MNVFKGLLFLLDSSTPSHSGDTTPHYGAATAADRFGRPLGNRAASEQWFGRRATNEDSFRADAVELKCCA